MPHAQAQCMDDWELEQMSLSNSHSHFRDDSGEEAADLGIIVADVMLYSVAGVSVFFAISSIWGGEFNPMNWEWNAVDWMLLGPGIGLWLCSQSINDFKRLLPIWVRAMLGMQMTPKDVADMSESAVSRRAFTLLLAGLLAGIVAWRFSSIEHGLENRTGIPFEYVVGVLAVALFGLGLMWKKLARKESGVVNLHDRY